MSEAWAFADHRIFESDDGEGGALVFGADHASLFAIDRATREAIERWRDRAPIVLDDVPQDDRDVLDALAGAQLLVPAARLGRRPRAPIDPAAVPLGTLVLEAAQTCNLRCTYCYAGGGSYGGEARVMRPDLAARAARHLVLSSGARETVTMVLFGGEPLMNLPALRAAVAAGEAAAMEHGKTFVVSITTNGTRFSPEALDFIAEHRIGVSVSIDGPPDLHDANRRYAGRNGGGTYADVVEGVARLTERTGRPPAARVTLEPRQWSRIPEVFEHVRSLGFLEVAIAPSSPVTAALLPTPEDEAALLAGFTSLAHRFVEEAAGARVLPFSNLLDLLAKLHQGDVKAEPCGAGLGYVAMDAVGDFFLCHRFAGDAKFRVGSLDAGIDHAKIRACLDEQAAPRASGCSTCWARSLCAGGCHYENHQRESVLGLAQGGSCDFIRSWIELGIRVYGRLREDAGHPVLAFLGARASAESR
ncbi:MAG TPA: radical SAM protein [Casimicrobiaceae bacterium]|nr:radical SAM protein [Casimicrobiaceae bacterium]